MAIRYYSTNRQIKSGDNFTPFTGFVSFEEALLRGQAPDGGLFMPESIPKLALTDILSLKNAPYCEAAKLVARLFLEGELSINLIEQIAEDAYNFPVPLERVSASEYILHLDQGPTASFKDFAARMMARLMAALKPKGSPLNILVATSGDTGSAVGNAFHALDNISVTILYPRNEVSDLQKQQLDTIGDNVQALSVEGKFDDCQHLVKQAFTDPELARYNLNSANSINFGRIMPQIIYYVYAYAQLVEANKAGEEIIFSVPSGNFGNALGCEFARRMGLPVRRLLMPVNDNDEFPKFLQSGVYRAVSPSRACLSNAMNVGNPSNLARFFDLYGGTLNSNGVVHRQPDLASMRQKLFSVSISDADTLATIKNIYEKWGVVLEPHGAVAWSGWEAYLHQHGDAALCVILETAHPAKFPEAVAAACGIFPTFSPSLQHLSGKSGFALPLSADYGEFKKYLMSNLPS